MTDTAQTDVSFEPDLFDLTADIVSAYFEATELAGFSEREAVKYFGRPRGFFAAQFDLDPKPAHVVQREFIARFEAIETSRKAER